MLVSLNWLREYVEDGLTVEELAAQLTASGSSVERTIQVGQGLDDLIVGLVEDVRPHPNADRLRLAKVNTGQDVVEVVCGATNLEAGQHIVYAKEGAYLPVNMHDDQRQPFVLKKATIRGIDSHGMICSVAEMGLGEDHDGILILPQSTKVGQRITEALDYPQTVFDIEVTTNRSDELAMIGIAREVSALTGKPLKLPTTKVVQPAIKGGYSPLIQTEDCYRLMVQQLTVEIGPSPWWMQQRLALAGMRPINNVVDITNYVMLEYGQPLHAYDTSQLHGKQLVARSAVKDEKITTLDGVERKLESGMMVIADETTPVAIAGIMGGEASKITERATSILLEAAVFNPISVRRTANQLALRSEASRRFERNVDREMTSVAMERAVDLLIKHAQAKVASAVQDNFPTPIESKQVTLHAAKLNQYFGQKVDPSQVRSILISLGFGNTQAFGNDTDWEISVRVPSWRAHDIEEEVDLIEEVVRMVGYESLPISLPNGDLPNREIEPQFARRNALRQALARAGWTEILSVSLVGESLLQQVNMSLPQIKIANPLSTEWTHLRSSLLPGLIKSASDNIRWNTSLKLFELGAIYLPAKQSSPNEDLHLGLISCTAQSQEIALAELKGTIQFALHQLGIDHSQISFVATDQNLAPFEDKRSGHVLVNSKIVGNFGLLPQSLRDSLRLPQSALLAELNLVSLISGFKPTQLQSISEFPSLEEDISVIVPEATPAATALELIEAAGQPLLESAALQEIYRHAKIGENLKSLTFHLVYRASDRTLSSKEISVARKKIATNLAKEDMHVRE